MKDPIIRSGLRKRFWERIPLKNLSPKEWEAVCDGCGKCCLNKLEDPDTGEVAFTRVACRLLDEETCRCAQYDIRRQFSHVSATAHGDRYISASQHRCIIHAVANHRNDGSG